MWYMVAQRFTQITPLAAPPDQLWQRVEAAWSAVPQEHIQSLFESIPRRVVAPWKQVKLFWGWNRFRMLSPAPQESQGKNLSRKTKKK
ncbi:transposable element Tcb1 transposase [Trichonephila clavipes]|nr:transposable element Tcb1 transposase [Trichonephila clavipes]